MKNKTVYVCSNCGYKTTKWYGKCPNCQEWGTLEEIKDKSTRNKTSVDYKKPQKLQDVNIKEERLKINKEFDNFINGFIKGGVYLLSGTPGIGKSTLLLQISQDLANNGAKVVYVSAEESVAQVSVRAKRLGVDKIYVISENDIDSILAMAENEKPDVLIIDSIHTVYSRELESSVGGVQQVRYSAERIIDVAKSRNIATIIVAHVTKDGSIAGPKMLEHMVDTVLFIEGEDDYRVLRLQKNRYGPTDESLIFEMKQNGLRVVDDPTVKFVEEKRPSDGMVYGMVVEGRYPIIVEVQALCVETPLAIPRRVSVGFDLNRLNMLLAVVEKKLNLPMYKYDVYLNIAGGIKISSTLVDLAVVGGIVSSVKKRILPQKTVFVGELDLSGNIRILERYKKYVTKIEKSGFNVVSSMSNVDDIFKLVKFINNSRL